VDNSAWRDLRDALRGLRRAPALITVIVLSLALGIGVNSALFTLFRLVDRSLPGAGTVVRVESRGENGSPGYAVLGFREFVELRERTTTLSSVAASYIRPVVISSGDPSQVPPLVLGEFVPDTFFEVFAVPMARGRPFTRDEAAMPGGDAVAVLSHAFWQRHFGGRDDVVGQPLTINTQPFVVVGVTAAGFVPPGFGAKAEVWLPYTMRGRLFPERVGTAGTEVYDESSRPWLVTFGRLAPGRTLNEARAEIRVLLDRLRDPQAPPRYIDVTPVTVLGAPGLASSIGRARAIAMGGTAIVLLIVCTNIAALLLARATAARKEIAVRLCLGATRGRLLRTFLIESLLLAAIGGGAGLLVAWTSLRAFLTTIVFSAMGHGHLAGIAQVNIAPDPPVLAFTLGASCLACLVFGMVPAWQATSGDLLPSVKDAAGVMARDGGRSRLRSGLVVAQAALSLVLLIGSGLLLRGIDRVQRMEPSVDPNRNVLLTVWIRQAAYDVVRAQQVFRDLDERLRALPGVTAVARVTSIPAEEEELEVTPVDASSTSGSARSNAPIRGFSNDVTPGYFDVVRRPIVRGRAFTEDERRRGDAVVVSESMAQRLWPDRDPLGQHVDGLRRGRARVVGVGPDATDILGAPRPVLYAPLDTAHDHESRAHMLVRVSGEAADALSVVKATAHAVDPSLHMTVETVASRLSSAFRLARTASVLSACLGFLALALASLGFYGLLAFLVSRRTREIGLRIALGAARRDVRRLVMGYGLRLGLCGVALGLVAGASAARVLSSHLFGLSPFDPVAYLVPSLLMLAIVLIACLVPARRAMRVNPIVLLRHD
jgi:putative ABC transport system permease protein